MTFFQRHAYRIGYGFAAALWPFFIRRRRISVENILRCHITTDPSEARRIAKASFCHLAGHIGEALCVPGVVTRENWREHLDLSGADPETVKLLLETPQTPILLASGHLGAWEAATNILSFARPMVVLFRPMNNKFLASWMQKHHFRGSVTLVSKNGGFTPDVLSEWKTTCAALTILMDQHAGRNGLRLDFLGRPAMTFTSVSRLAARTGVPIVVGGFVRVAPYRYRLVGDKPLTFEKNVDKAAATQLLNDRLAACIRAYPEQYFWCHRRWRVD